VPCRGAWCTRKPGLGSPFNLNVQRNIRYMDNCLPEWRGRLVVNAEGLQGPCELAFDGVTQGAFDGDIRPILVADGFRFVQPGFHFVTLTDPESGLEAHSHAVRRIYLTADISRTGAGLQLTVRAAAADGVREVCLVRGGEDGTALRPEHDARVVEGAFELQDLAPTGFVYVRVLTRTGDMAWSSPLWGDELA